MPESETLNITSNTEACVTAHEGDKYLNFLSQLRCVNAGHGNETINATLRDQLDRIAYVSPSKRNDARATLSAAGDEETGQ